MVEEYIHIYIYIFTIPLNHECVGGVGDGHGIEW